MYSRPTGSPPPWWMLGQDAALYMYIHEYTRDVGYMYTIICLPICIYIYVIRMLHEGTSRGTYTCMRYVTWVHTLHRAHMELYITYIHMCIHGPLVI